MPIPVPAPDADLVPSLVGDLDRFQADDTTQALEAALAAVRNYCGWHIAPILTETVTLRSPDCASLFLPTANLIAVTAVSQLGSAVDVATMITEPTGAVTRALGYRYLRTDDLITVTFVHGYDTLPDDVRQVVLSLAQRMLDNPASGRSVSQVGQVSTTFVRGGAVPLMDADLAILDAYRILAFA